MADLALNHAPRLFTVPMTEMLRPRFGGGPIELPVENYSPVLNFKYVQGVPAGAEGGFSVSRLQILDTLIERLVSMKQEDAIQNVPENPGKLSSSQLDVVIEGLAKKLQVASTATIAGTAQSIGSSFGMAVSQTGTAVSMLV